MMKRLLTFCAAALFAAQVFSAEAPDALVTRVSTEVLEIVKKDESIRNGDIQKITALVDAKVLPHFDFQRMTALAVGRDWRSASTEQKKRLTEEFKALLVRTYANAVSSYSNQKLVVKPLKMKAGESEVLVRSEIQQPGTQPVQLDYWLELQGENWKVFDVVVAGISLVTNYREQFAKEVREHGIDGLIGVLVSKNKSLESGAAKTARK